MRSVSNYNCNTNCIILWSGFLVRIQFSVSRHGFILCKQFGNVRKFSLQRHDENKLPGNMWLLPYGASYNRNCNLARYLTHSCYLFKPCVDTATYCEANAKMCDNNVYKELMTKNCPKTCNICVENSCGGFTDHSKFVQKFLRSKITHCLSLTCSQIEVKLIC